MQYMDHDNVNGESTEQVCIRRSKLLELQNMGDDPFKIAKYEVSNTSLDIRSCFDRLEGCHVSVAGRIMSRRIMGKASFFHIQDSKGRLQIYIKKEDVKEDEYLKFKQLDIGDILGVQGVVFRTNKGEISVKAINFKLLAKSLQVLPEKWHGLKDVDLRYRQRYLDLIVNPEVKDIFMKRSHIIRSIRKFLDTRGFLEVETPILQSIAGGAAARPFTTHHNALDIDLYMRIALELPLKKLIISGIDKVYELGRVFRNEGLSIKHNPEFTMMELYEAYSDYEDMMNLIEELIREVMEEVIGSASLDYEGLKLDFSKPFCRLTMLDAVKDYAGVDFDTINSIEEAMIIAKEHGLDVEPFHKKGDVLNLFFEAFVEHKLIEPTFLIDHPVEISPLTKKKPDNPEYVERFELYIMGREFANAYSELNDPLDQRERFMHQAAMREQGNEEANVLDEEFLMAMEYGMPPAGGLGLGIDRFVMLLTQASSIRDVLLFPTMKIKKT